MTVCFWQVVRGKFPAPRWEVSVSCWTFSCKGQAPAPPHGEDLALLVSIHPPCGFLAASDFGWLSGWVERPARISGTSAMAGQWDEKTFIFPFACEWTAPEGGRTVKVTCPLWGWVSWWVKVRWGVGSFCAKNLSTFSTQKWSMMKGKEQKEQNNMLFASIPSHAESFYQIPGSQDITEIIFLIPHLLIGNVMGLLWLWPLRKLPPANNVAVIPIRALM